MPEKISPPCFSLGSQLLNLALQCSQATCFPLIPVPWVSGSSWDREAQPGAGKPLWEQHLSLELRIGGEGAGSCLSLCALQQQTGAVPFSWLVIEEWFRELWEHTWAQVLCRGWCEELSSGRRGCGRGAVPECQAGRSFNVTWSPFCNWVCSAGADLGRL